jgi:transcriptional regulator with XRE-family HTH domain
MTDVDSPNQATGAYSRRVSSELRRYREEAGYTGMQAAEVLGMSPSKISRIENGNRGLNATDVAALLTVYQVPDQQRYELLDLLHRSEAASPSPRRGVALPKAWKNLARLEARAVHITAFEPQVVPDLAQIPEYAAEVIGGLHPELSVGELDQLVASRIGRQVRLRHPDVHYLAVLDEVALRRVLGGALTMRRQLRHLTDLAEQSNVTVRIVPFAAGAHRGLRGPFTVLDFAEEPSTALVDDHADGTWLDEEDDLAALRGTLTGILANALEPEESLAMLSEIAYDNTTR